LMLVRDVKLAQLLIDHGADVNARDNSGNTPLITACENGRPEIAKLLIQYYKDERSKTPLPLPLACWKWLTQIFTGPNPKVNTKNTKGKTPLIKACEQGHIEVAQLLIDNGAKINIKDNNGNTALMVTSDDKVKQLLKSHGAK
jgi:ankyrin repeat protein